MLTLQPYDPSNEDAWERFLVERSRNGTFLHSRAFFAHNPANALDDSSALFLKSGRVVAVLPATLRDAPEGRVLHSHSRSTYGGLVISDDIGTEEAIECIDLFVGFGKERGATEIVVRNPFRIFHLTPCDEVDFALWNRGFRIKYRELESAIPLTGWNPDDVLQHFEPKTRNQVRRAYKSGVSVEHTEDFAAFWGILEQNLQEKHGVPPTHTLKEMQSLRALVGGDRIRLFGAYVDRTMIAGLLVFVPNRAGVHAQYIGSLPSFAAMCPVNALIEAVAAWSVRGGFRYLNLGMATEDQGQRVNRGLYKFKEGFGAKGVLRETMHLMTNEARSIA